MNFIWGNRFIYWNFVVLIIIKVIFSYSSFQLADTLIGQPIFPREEVVSQVNNFRDSLGLPKLKENQALDAAAAQKLNDMIKQQYFAHYSPSGISPWSWIEGNKYSFNYAGENLAIGFLKAGDVVRAWVDSPSHRENLANSHYRETGVAVASTKINGEEGILVVQLYASPAPIAPPIALKPKTQISNAPTISPNPTAQPVAPSQVSLVSVKNIETKSGPATVQVSENNKKLDIPNISQRLNTAVNITNNSLIFYTFLVLIVSIILLTFKTITKGLLVKSVINFAIFFLAVAIPVIQGLHPAFIF